MSLAPRNDLPRIQAPAPAPPALEVESSAKPARADRGPAEDNIHAAKDRQAAGGAHVTAGGKVGGLPQGSWSLKSPPANTTPTPQLLDAARDLVAKAHHARETLPLRAAVAQSTSAVAGLRKINSVLSERFARAAETHDRMQLPIGARIVEGAPYFHSTRGVAAHLAELAAKPGSGTLAQHVNGTYMVAHANEDVATIFNRWDEARNRSQDSPADAQQAYASVHDLLHEEYVRLEAQNAALALSPRSGEAGSRVAGMLFRLVFFLGLLLSLTVAPLAHAGEPRYAGRWVLDRSPKMMQAKSMGHLEFTIEHGPGAACAHTITYKDPTKKRAEERGTCVFKNTGPGMYEIVLKAGDKGSTYEFIVSTSGKAAALTPIKGGQRNVVRTMHFVLATTSAT